MTDDGDESVTVAASNTAGAQGPGGQSSEEVEDGGDESETVAASDMAEEQGPRRSRGKGDGETAHQERRQRGSAYRRLFDPGGTRRV